MLLHADPTKTIKQPYQMVTVSYFPTSVQRLYRIGTTGDWKPYQDKPIWVNQGETLYSKGIDIYGNETRIVSSYKVNVTDAIMPPAYDENDSTSLTNQTNKFMKVDQSMHGKKIRVLLGHTYSSGSISSTIRFLDKNKTVISSVVESSIRGTFTRFYTIPVGTVWIKYESIRYSSYATYLYEIEPSNEPTFNVTNGYMLLHADPTKAIKQPYQMVTINYFPTSVQRLYRIGTEGEWKSYQNTPVWVKQGETIYSKGIDQYGNETRIVSSYTVNVTDSITSPAYDENDSTRLTNQTNKYMKVDPSMHGKQIRVLLGHSYNSGSIASTIRFLNENKVEISNVVASSISGTFERIYTIPVGTVWIKYESIRYSSYGTYLYEIEPRNEPIFKPENGYMLLHADPTKQIKQPYQMITINYFPTSVQRLYRIGTEGEWLSYTDQPVWVNQGQTIYARGIDQYGNETRIVSSYKSQVADGLDTPTYDGNNTTGITNHTNKYMKVDPSMHGKQIIVRLGHSYSSGSIASTFRFLDKNKTEISKVVVSSISGTFERTYTIPAGTVWIKYESIRYSSYKTYLYEIKH